MSFRQFTPEDGPPVWVDLESDIAHAWMAERWIGGEKQRDIARLLGFAGGMPSAINTRLVRFLIKYCPEMRDTFYDGFRAHCCGEDRKRALQTAINRFRQRYPSARFPDPSWKALAEKSCRKRCAAEDAAVYDEETGWELLPVDELNLPVRAQNCLKNESIFLVGDLVNCTAVQLLRWPNFGRGSLEAIKTALERRGLSLRE